MQQQRPAQPKNNSFTGFIVARTQHEICALNKSSSSSSRLLLRAQVSCKHTLLMTIDTILYRQSVQSLSRV